MIRREDTYSWNFLLNCGKLTKRNWISRIFYNYKNCKKLFMIEDAIKKIYMFPFSFTYLKKNTHYFRSSFHKIKIDENHNLIIISSEFRIIKLSISSRKCLYFTTQYSNNIKFFAITKSVLKYHMKTSHDV